jgi:hypothetical protein
MPLKVRPYERFAEVINTSVTFANTASSTATVTHGLSAAPDWIAFYTDDNTPAISYTSNTTSVTFTRTATTTSGTARVDVIAAIAS